MGSVVAADDARETQIADARKARAAAQARGGDAQADAEERLGPVLATYDAAEAEAKSLADAATSARAKRTAADDNADGTTIEVLDDLFEAGGRRRGDPFLALSAPGGATGITVGPLDEQPLRMRFAARVLAKMRHPRIPAATLQGAAARLEAAAAPLAQVIAETAPQIAEADMADKVLTALARLARNELMALKRLWIGKGWSEADVHTIIPDRPAPKPKKPTEG